jgi:hypothetical protein
MFIVAHIERYVYFVTIEQLEVPYKPPNRVIMYRPEADGSGIMNISLLLCMVW